MSQVDISLRLCASTRKDAATHYFLEGGETTLCGQELERFRVVRTGAPLSCRACAGSVPREYVKPFLPAPPVRRAAEDAGEGFKGLSARQVETICYQQARRDLGLVDA